MSDATLAKTPAAVQPVPPSPETRRAADLGARVSKGEDGRMSLQLSVEGMHCANCMQTVETTLQALHPSVVARVNLSAGRLALSWATGSIEPIQAVGAVEAKGFGVRPWVDQANDATRQEEGRKLLRCMAVAGFAAANVMLLSISVWAGGTEMGAGTVQLFHWISALIALPAIAYSGSPFFASAWAAVRGRRLNMEVPISIAVILAAGLSVSETFSGGDHAFYDAAVTLLFFLLVGRYLDDRARARAGSAAAELLATMAGKVTRIQEDGTQSHVDVSDLDAGITILVATGERIAADGTIIEGRSDLDTSLVTGESLPESCGPGDAVFGGVMNLSAPLVIAVSKPASRSLMAEIVELIETSEQSKAQYVALAEKAVKLYAPVVHLAALLTFAGWWLIGGALWQDALYTAIAVLIITCPCAIGLAVPVVQVIASGRLFRQGILLKSGDALERIAEIDTVVFDKTGTLTFGKPVMTGDVDEETLCFAAALARHSNHPLSQALLGDANGSLAAEDVQEFPGEGLAGIVDGRATRLGNRDFCGIDGTAHTSVGPELWLQREGMPAARFTFEDEMRPDAAQVISELKAQGLDVVLVSGDRSVTAEAFAHSVGINDWHGEVKPGEKSAMIEELTRKGRKALMVGDGLNDAPALAAAYASLSPSTAADIAQTAADVVFQGKALSPVLEVLKVARSAKRRMLENFAFAAVYNAVAIPAAIIGLVTPLIAALAMSASSLVVISNALRLKRRT